MHRLIVFFIFALSFQAVFASAHCLAIDGDTLFCDGVKIRLANVYAAEKNEVGGAQAKANLTALINSGEVTLNVSGVDRYHRTLAKVSVNGREITQSDIGPRAGRGTRALIAGDYMGEGQPLYGAAAPKSSVVTGVVATAKQRSAKRGYVKKHRKLGKYRHSVRRHTRG